jgi:hypothetical protein
LLALSSAMRILAFSADMGWRVGSVVKARAVRAGKEFAGPGQEANTTSSRCRSAFLL